MYKGSHFTGPQTISSRICLRLFLGYRGLALTCETRAFLATTPASHGGEQDTLQDIGHMGAVSAPTLRQGLRFASAIPSLVAATFGTHGRRQQKYKAEEEPCDYTKRGYATSLYSAYICRHLLADIAVQSRSCSIGRARY